MTTVTVFGQTLISPKFHTKMTKVISAMHAYTLAFKFGAILLQNQKQQCRNFCQFLPRDAIRIARYCYGKVVCLPACPSVCDVEVIVIT